MQRPSGEAEVKSRFGRCPYCRAMIYQDLNAVIFYCSKCRTPIRGKNPRPADETEYALAQLEILSADTASVFSDDVEPSSDPRPTWPVEDDYYGEQLPPRSRSTPYRNVNAGSFQQGTGASSARELGSVRTGQRSGAGAARDNQTEAARGGSPVHSRVTELRPSSRRTRRSMSGDVDVRSDAGSGTDSEADVPVAPAAFNRRRASPLSSQELETATVLSGFEVADLSRTQLSDPAFQKDLLQALDKLRMLIAAVDHPRSIDGQWHAAGAHRSTASCSENGAGGKPTVTRRSSRLMRRLESHLTQALPAGADRPSRDASVSSSASSSRRGGFRARAHHCRPVLGGAPFVVCDKCSEILQLPEALPLPVGRVARVLCGGCDEELELTLPASGSTDRPKKIFSAPQPAGCSAEDTDEIVLARSNLSGEQPGTVGSLHRMLGYSSVSSVLRSRRYGEQN